MATWHEWDLTDNILAIFFVRLFVCLLVCLASQRKFILQDIPLFSLWWTVIINVFKSSQMTLASFSVR